MITFYFKLLSYNRIQTYLFFVFVINNEQTITVLVYLVLIKPFLFIVTDSSVIFFIEKLILNVLILSKDFGDF